MANSDNKTTKTTKTKGRKSAAEWALMVAQGAVLGLAESELKGLRKEKRDKLAVAAGYASFDDIPATVASDVIAEIPSAALVISGGGAGPATVTVTTAVDTETEEAEEAETGTELDDTEGWPEAPSETFTEAEFEQAEQSIEEQLAVRDADDALAANDEYEQTAVEQTMTAAAFAEQVELANAVINEIIAEERAEKLEAEFIAASNEAALAGDLLDEVDTLVQEINAEEAEIDALMDAVEVQPGLTADQRDEVTKLQATTLVFEIVVKRRGFRRQVSADDVVKGDLDTPVSESLPNIEQELDAKLEADASLSEPEKARVRRRLLKVSKRILECDELDAIDQTIRDFKKWLENRRIPCSILRGGRYVIPTAYVAEVENRFQEFRARRRACVKAFLLAYDQRIAEAEAEFVSAGVGTLFRRADFPGKEELARSYNTQREWRAFDAPKALQTIKASMWTDAQAQIEIQLAGVADEAKDALRATFASYVDWMVDRLTVEEGQTKKKAINENKVGQLVDFLASVDKLNISGDKELEQFVAQARNVVTGVDLKSLKKDDAVRDKIRASFETLKESTGTWIVEKDRVICFDEEAV